MHSMKFDIWELFHLNLVAGTDAISWWCHTVVNVAVLLILNYWRHLNSVPSSTAWTNIICISFMFVARLCAWFNITSFIKVLNNICCLTGSIEWWFSELQEVFFFLCIAGLEWMKNHSWESFESVLNYCICDTFNFEINLCNICDSCICIVLKLLCALH